jgi:hypothetical protein
VRRWAWLLTGSVLVGSAVLVALGRSSLADTQPPALDARLSVRSASRLLADGRLEPGEMLVPASFAARLEAQAASAALAAIPLEFAPSAVILELFPKRAPGVPPINGVECHGESGTLLLGNTAPQLPKSVWLHELAHVRLHGARPSAMLAKRLITALEEGVADDYAAVLGGSAVLGFGAEQRDLRQPPSVGPSDWASLAFPDFDPHRLGWALAAALYAAEPRAGALLEEAIACLDGPGPLRYASSPASAIASLLESCPEPGRQPFRTLLSDWLPPAFFNESSSP